LKYVNKTVLGEDKTYAALLFASNKRMFSMSHGLRDMLCVRRKTEKQGYFFEGTVGEGEVRAFCLEQNLIYDDFVRANVTADILCQYAELFNIFDI
jgi:hypothetical protein